VRRGVGCHHLCPRAEIGAWGLLPLVLVCGSALWEPAVAAAPQSCSSQVAIAAPEEANVRNVWPAEQRDLSGGCLQGGLSSQV